MFDCVIPTREGRHGRLFIKNTSGLSANKFHEAININNQKYQSDFSPIDKNCNCELCQNYTRAYLHHIFALKDPLAMRLASMHNLKFYMDLMEELRS